MMWLFDRVFRQPATHNVMPEENLATEVTAFFLDHCAPFRERLLAEIGLSGGAGEWTVITQRRLFGPGRWHNMVPDIMLVKEAHRVRVVVEVKIDARPTLDKEGRPQTCAYADYLADERQSERCVETRLVALVRWLPEASFKKPCDRIVRFNDLAHWLEDVANADPDNVTAVLAGRWGDYIRARRWAMQPITAQHVAAISQIEDLVAQLWEVLSAAQQEAIGTGRWRAHSRSSSGRYVDERSARRGEVLWNQIHLAEDPAGWIQLGCFYGNEADQVAIRGVIWVHEACLRRLSPKASGRLEDAPWRKPPGKLIWLENIVAQVGNADAWDQMRQGFMGIMAEIK